MRQTIPSYIPARQHYARLDGTTWVILSLLAFITPLAHTPALRHLLLLFALLLAVINVVLRRIPFRQISICLPWFLIAVLTVLWSPAPKTSFIDALWGTIGPVAACILSINLSKRVKGGAFWLPFAALFLGLLLGLIGGLADHLGSFAEQLSWLIQIYPKRGVASTIGVLAVIIGMFMVVDHTQNIEKSYLMIRRPMGIAIIFIGMALGVLGHNRMFWFALLVGLLPWLIYLRLLPWKRQLSVIVLIAGVAAAGFFYANFTSRHLQVNNITSLVAKASKQYNNDPRWDIWYEWVTRVIADHPLRGYGFGIRVQQQVGLQRIPHHIDNFDANGYHHAHNVFLNVLVQTGLIGLGCFLLMITTFAKEAIKNIQNQLRNNLSPASSIAALSLLLAAITKSLTDDFFWDPAGIIMWIFLGILIGAGRKST